MFERKKEKKTCLSRMSMWYDKWNEISTLCDKHAHLKNSIRSMRNNIFELIM